jgi:DNA-binding beta-propeller fold protein YncE
VLDLKARREIAAIGAGEEPAAARLSPDNKTLVVANRRGNSVSLFDPATRRVRAIFEGCPGASDAVILPDSSKAFVPCSAGHQIIAIALAHTEIRPAQPGSAQLVPARPDRLEALLDVGQAPMQLALKPDAGEVFALNSLSDSISEVITTSDDVSGSTIIGDNPVRGIVSADNAMLYVANFRSQYVTVYAIDEGQRLRPSIHVGDGPSALAFSSSGLLLFVVDARSGDVAVVRTASLSFFTLLPAGRAPNAIAVKAFKLP